MEKSKQQKNKVRFVVVREFSGEKSMRDVYKIQDERFVDEHTLTTSISRIRSKIESDGGAPYIKTVYGMGYQWTGGEAK